MEATEEAIWRGKLVHCTDDVSGIRRTGEKDAFTYIGPDGKQVRDPETLERIQALVIPPNWQDVWICTDPC